MFKKLPGAVRKLLPTIVLVVLAVLAGATNVFTSEVHKLVAKLFQDFAKQLLPFAVNALVGAIVLNLAYLLYHPLRNALLRVMKSGQASERHKNLIVRGMQLAYWGVALFVALTIVAPDVLSKVFLGGSFLIAALIVALQGVANDLICGIMLQFSPRCKKGDEICPIGLENAKGTVDEIGYLSTRIETADGVVRVPNREIWARAIKVVAPVKPPSLIILPPGVTVERDDGKPQEKQGTGESS